MATPATLGLREREVNMGEEVRRIDLGDVPSHVQLPPGPWATLLDGLCARFPAIDGAMWADRFARGRVQASDGTPLAPEAPYRVGLDVTYFREVPDEPRIPFELDVLHVDDHLVVVDKPHFLPVVPAGRYVQETVLGRLRPRFGAALVPLHRIDRETAGLVLCSIDPATRGVYQALFRDRRITKQYEALAPPSPQEAFPQVRASRLVRGSPFFRMQEVPGEANSHTRIDVLERDGALWRYALEPVTGRKHQLRVHMAALGAPIAGDRLYPQLRDGAGDAQAPPLQLLARSLAFVDPLTGTPRRFESRQRLQR